VPFIIDFNRERERAKDAQFSAVAQIGNLLYRRLAIGQAQVWAEIRRLPSD
jgi:hypothetical protein